MSVDYSNLLSCNYGTAAFQVEEYTYRSADVVKENLGRTGIRCEVNIKGYLQGSDPADLSGKVGQFADDALIDGRDLYIYGIGGADNPEFFLLNAWCYDGGPHVACELTTHNVALTKKVQLTVTASLIPPELRGNPNSVTDTFTVQVQTRPDGLRTITRSGVLQGLNLATYFLNTLLPAVRASYANGYWTLDSSYQTTIDPQTTTLNVQLQYQVKAVEHFQKFPPILATPVDGSLSIRTDRDEQMRQTIVYDLDALFDATVPADFAVNQMRQLITGTASGHLGQGGAVILRENVSIETVKENHVKASFTVLQSGSGNPQMNWGSSIQVTEGDAPYEEITYVGADPILVQRPRTLPRARQSGSATAIGVYRRPPSPFFPLLAADRQFTLTELNDVEKQSSWNYEVFATDDRGNPIDLYATQNAGTMILNLRRNLEQGFYPAPPPPPPPPPTGP